jgi:hemerythrin
MKTKVIFKKLTFFSPNIKETIKEINAIFPEYSQKDASGEILYQGYAHIGQHTLIHEDFLKNGIINNCKIEDATEEEFAELKQELISIGYEL